MRYTTLIAAGVAHATDLSGPLRAGVPTNCHAFPGGIPGFGILALAARVTPLRRRPA